MSSHRAATSSHAVATSSHRVARWRWSHWYWGGRWWVWRTDAEDGEAVEDLGRWLWQDMFGWGWWRLAVVDGSWQWLWRSTRPAPGQWVVDGDWRVVEDEFGDEEDLVWEQWADGGRADVPPVWLGGGWLRGPRASPGMAWAT